ncbi:uncharacterized protein BBA_09818 [Beauveria bassiana ARSEF 2860]|uniref:Uncharacterized protein n=1 Tax=Beauveria bassiana (strain ARSEF 2860) TaxID=655819 RepID=J5JBC5_BEAB2|nr:uncharacterized protein BBA_09818 [Beauveria bassiana ARSEF 2860]EJP61241.1 hypothetical protein BBA_09818 [Beauveria bassiana ARSEF 2860]
MARIAAVALLAFAVSALAAPQAPEDTNEPILDFEGNPLSEAKQKEFLELDQEGQKKYDELVATYTKEQQGIHKEIQVISAKQGVILRIPKSDEKESAP